MEKCQIIYPQNSALFSAFVDRAGLGDNLTWMLSTLILRVLKHI